MHPELAVFCGLKAQAAEDDLRHRLMRHAGDMGAALAAGRGGNEFRRSELRIEPGRGDAQRLQRKARIHFRAIAGERNQRHAPDDGVVVKRRAREALAARGCAEHRQRRHDLTETRRDAGEIACRHALHARRLKGRRARPVGRIRASGEMQNRRR